MAGTAHRNEFGDYAALTAYADAQWAEPGAGLPSDEHSPRSDVVPQIGSHRLLSLLLPGERKSSSTPFWVLFEPGLASLNGWDLHPDQIDRSAFVQCRLLKTARSDDETRWLDIAIEDVAPLPLLTQRFPPRRVDQLGIWELGKAALTRQEHMALPFRDRRRCRMLAVGPRRSRLRHAHRRV